MNDENLYLEATNEVEGENRKPSLWAKVMDLSEGDEEKAKYKYIKLRVEQLASERKNAAEFESGDIDKSALGLLALAIHGGDREKAKYEYVRLKVAGEKVAETSLENGNEGGQALSHTEGFFNGGHGWLVALSPCVIGAVILSNISQKDADQTFSFLLGQVIGITVTSALPGLFIGGVYILANRPQIGGDVILKKWICGIGVIVTIFMMIGFAAV